MLEIVSQISKISQKIKQVAFSRTEILLETANMETFIEEGNSSELLNY